jgi:hypothetical protein
MAAPRIEVVGVYRLDVPEDLFREQFDILYGDPMSDEERVEAEKQCRERLSSVVLIELLVENRDAGFSISDFSQPQDGVPKENWQVAWTEMFLATDGNSLLVEKWGDPPDAGDFRVAFFMHFWDEMQPLITSHGEVTCPPISKMPERLKTLVPYKPVD